MQQLIPVPQLPLETLLLVLKNSAILILVLFVTAVSLGMELQMSVYFMVLPAGYIYLFLPILLEIDYK